MNRSLREHPGKKPARGDFAQPGVSLVTYEEQLGRDLRWAMSEASEFFEGKGGVQQALRKITDRLNKLGIDYAVAGGLALFFQGFRRFTEDVDILVTRAGLKTLHEKLEGLGWVPPFAGSKNLRDAENGVKIEFLVTGDYPGDGKPKPVAFPDPAKIAVAGDGISYLNLPTLVELKLASGMTNADRMKDLADVQELIKILNLPADFAGKLDPFVRVEFAKLWNGARPKAKHYLLYRTVENDAVRLQAMQADGVTVENEGGTEYLVSTDPDVARKYEMHDLSEYLDEDFEESGDKNS